MTTSSPSVPTPANQPVGIASLGLAFPSLVLPLEELAELRGAEAAKYTIGLGCQEMAICAPGEGVVELAVRAAERALERWGGDRSEIGLVAVGTESAIDMSRPLSAWVADQLGLSGAVRSYEVKHACYGGTLALRQAVEWKLAGTGRGAALVIAADIALYAPEDPGEPTQGAGAVAMVVDTPDVAVVDGPSFPWSEPAFDFWRPVGEDFPQVDGKFSLECYKTAAEHCFRAWLGDRAPNVALNDFSALCFHVPFPKMVSKTVLHLGERLGMGEGEVRQLLAEKIDPSMEWNRRTGNAYTASLWVAVARALAGATEGDRFAAFSYGSGYGAELLTLSAGPKAADAPWVGDAEADFASRERIDAARYLALRGTPVALSA